MQLAFRFATIAEIRAEFANDLADEYLARVKVRERIEKLLAKNA